MRSKYQARHLPLVLLGAFLAATTALAAESGGHMSSHGGWAEAVFVADIVLLLVVGRGLGEILERFGQPAIMGQLIGGILLGPSLFGWLWPSAQHLVFAGEPAQKSMIDAVSQLGILMLLLLTGMETDLRLVRRVGAASIAISATGVVVPFIWGYVLAQFLPDSLLPEPTERTVGGLFLGTALSVSSVKIVAVIVREMNFIRRNLGQVIISSAIIEDTIGWLVIAVTSGLPRMARSSFSRLPAPSSRSQPSWCSALRLEGASSSHSSAGPTTPCAANMPSSR
jgi:Kef-type K+ transport system membrane component KefB